MRRLYPAVAIRSTASLGGDLALLGSIARAPSAVFGTLLVWQSRANQRARLAEMESHRLEDMGITPAEARREAAKPLWHA